MRTRLLPTILFAALMSSVSAQVVPTLPTEPTFPDDAKVYDVTSYGAVGDGVTDDTEAVQAAIDACAAANDGGTVLLTGGKTYLTKTIYLKSNMTFKIDEATVIKCTGNKDDFPYQTVDTDNFPGWGSSTKDARAFIFAYKAENLRITGPGTIDGNGHASAFEGFFITETDRPIPLFMVMCNKVLFDNALLKDGAMWNVVPMETDDFTMRNVQIDANIVANRDGIDICDCHRVLVEDCSFYTDDDAICPKSGTERGVEDVTVRNCSIKKSGRANGIKFGTMSYGGFKRMLFHDIDMTDVNLCGIAVEAVDGAVIEDIEFRDITMDNCGTPLFIICGNRGKTSWGGQRRYGSINNILVKDVTARNNHSNYGIIISGTKLSDRMMRVGNITIDNFDATFTGGLQTVPATPGEYGGGYPESSMWGALPASGFFIRHADNVKFTNCDFVVQPSDVREFYVVDDATMTEDNCTLKMNKMENVANEFTWLVDDGIPASERSRLWDGSTSDGCGLSAKKGSIYFDLTKHYETPMNITGACIWQDGGGAHVDRWKVMVWDESTKWRPAMSLNKWVEVMPMQECSGSGYSYAEFDAKATKVRLYLECDTDKANLHEFSLYSNNAQVLPDGIAEVASDEAEKSQIYSVDGRKMKADTLQSLPAGVYICNGQKLVQR
jgi:polygalacturonase